MASFSEEGTAQLLFTPRRLDVGFIVRLGDGVVSSDDGASQNFISDGGPQSFLKLFRHVVGRAPHARERVTKTFIISGELLNAIHESGGVVPKQILQRAACYNGQKIIGRSFANQRQDDRPRTLGARVNHVVELV